MTLLGGVGEVPMRLLTLEGEVGASDQPDLSKADGDGSQKHLLHHQPPEP